jgi:hypothetical protein
MAEPCEANSKVRIGLANPNALTSRRDDSSAAYASCVVPTDQVVAEWCAVCDANCVAFRLAKCRSAFRVGAFRPHLSLERR